MRDPHRWRTIGLWGLGLGALSLALLPLGYDQGVGVRFALMWVGAMGVMFGGFLALFQHQYVRAKQALARGEDLIARWRVEADDWQRFLASDPQWSSHANGRLNEFSPSEAAEPNGVEVIVGKAAVQIGDSIHRVPLRSTPEITEALLHDGTPRQVAAPICPDCSPRSFRPGHSPFATLHSSAHNNILMIIQATLLNVDDVEELRPAASHVIWSVISDLVESGQTFGIPCMRVVETVL